MKIIYCDPMSYNNLSIYDRSLLNNIKNTEKIYFCNTKLEFENFENTTIKKIYNYSEKKGLFKALSYIKSQLFFFFYIFFTNPDLIHVQWIKSPNFDYFLYRILKVFKRVKVIFTAHNILPHDTGMKYKNIYGKIYQMVDKIIVHSSRTKEEIIQEFGISHEKIEVIPHGIIELESQGEVVSKKSCLLDKKNEKIISFIGHLNEYKGIDFLVDAWKESEILRNNKDIRLIIAGKGNVNFKGIEKLDNVTIINRFLENCELEEIIQKSDIFVLPYRKISQSGVLLSVLNYKKPVIVTNEGGLTDPFEFGKVGWIMGEKNSDSLRKILEDMSENLEEIEKIKNNRALWEKLHEIYDWKKIGDQTKNLYEQVVK